MYEYLIYGVFAFLCATAIILILTKSRLSNRLRLLTLILIPIISLSLYHLVGTPLQPDTPMSKREQLIPFIIAENQLLLVKPLETMLLENPDNIKLWQQLSEIYIAAGRIPQATKTLKQAYQQTNNPIFRNRLNDIYQEMPELQTSKSTAN